MLPIINLWNMANNIIQLAHGSGGKLSEELIKNLFLPRFGNEILNPLEDQAILHCPPGRIAFSTDSFVVDPLFFPGGDIGDLAVNGTVNDICMSGAAPLYLSVAFIIEEGFPIASLKRILLSMEKMIKQTEVKVVTGDTKVVSSGCCDKLFITTTGIGIIPDGASISSTNLKPGDKIILSGTIADHGMAIMTSRDNLSFKASIKSDTAPLNGLVRKISKNMLPAIHAMRDPTRGGLASTLNELAQSSQVGIVINEETIPVNSEVRGACEILGIDPLYVANEGKMVVVAAAEDAEEILHIMQNHLLGKNGVIIGEVTAEHAGQVTMRTTFGASRIVAMASGELLPRIC